MTESPTSVPALNGGAAEGPQSESQSGVGSSAKAIGTAMGTLTAGLGALTEPHQAIVGAIMILLAPTVSLLVTPAYENHKQKVEEKKRKERLESWMKERGELRKFVLSVVESADSEEDIRTLKDLLRESEIEIVTTLLRQHAVSAPREESMSRGRSEAR